MNTWAPLWSGIVESSIWDEPDSVVKVFLTMLAIKDADHVVRKSAYQISKLSRKSEVEVLDALKVLCHPDSIRKEKQPFDGRRIKAVEGGWLVLNGEKYRGMISLEMKRARNRRAQAAFRERNKEKTRPDFNRPLKGELEHIAAEKNGASQKRLDSIVTSSLPEAFE